MVTSRQQQVLTLVADGYTNTEIAESLGVAVETVKTHLKKVRAELGARNRAHAVALWLRP
jgi:DNA-binding CsgD family transcriptional regulator